MYKCVCVCVQFKCKANIYAIISIKNEKFYGIHIYI